MTAPFRPSEKVPFIDGRLQVILGLLHAEESYDRCRRLEEEDHDG